MAKQNRLTVQDDVFNAKTGKYKKQLQRGAQAIKKTIANQGKPGTPLFCTKCNNYGHVAKNCRNELP